MAFEELKSQLKEQWAELSAKIQESPAYSNAREKFESQTPTVQRAIIIGSALTFVLVLLSFPFGYISTSQENLSYFEENRTQIQALLRASRAAKEPSPLPASLPTEMLKARVESLLRENQLVPDQIGEIQVLPERPAKDLAPAGVTQTGIAVQVKKLNLKQILAINVGFQNMGAGIKLVGFDIVQSADQTHYYDMVARVVGFSLPAMSFENDPDAGKRGGPSKSRGKN